MDIFWFKFKSAGILLQTMTRILLVCTLLGLLAASDAFMASKATLPLRAAGKASTRNVCSALKMSGDHHEVEQVDRGSFIYTYAAIVSSPFIALLAKQITDAGSAAEPKAKAEAPKAEAPKAEAPTTN